MRTRIQTLLTKISPEGNFCSTLVLTGTDENLMSAFALLRWTRWGNVLKIKSKLDFVLQGNNSPDGVLEALPSQLLRKWKRASKMLNVACVLTKLPHRER